MPVVQSEPEEENTSADSSAIPAADSAPVNASVDTPVASETPAAGPMDAAVTSAPEIPVAPAVASAPVVDNTPAPTAPLPAAPTPPAGEAAPVVAAAPTSLDENVEQKGKKELEPETPTVPPTTLVGEGALPDYDWFLERKESDERTHAYISKDLYDNLAYVMQILGDKKGFTLTSYLNNIINQHFDQYGPEIRKRIREKEALLKKKRRF